MLLVASITSVPAGTCTLRSLIFSVTNFCGSAIRLSRTHGDERFGGFIRAAPVQVVLWDVDFLGGHQRAGTAAGNHGFEFLAAGNAAGHLVDELFHIHAEWNLVDTGFGDVTGDAE